MFTENDSSQCSTIAVSEGSDIFTEIHLTPSRTCIFDRALSTKRQLTSKSPTELHSDRSIQLIEQKCMVMKKNINIRYNSCMLSLGRKLSVGCKQDIDVLIHQNGCL